MRRCCKTHTDKQENDRLYHLVLAGDGRAEKELVVNNLPLVVSIVDSFITRCPMYEYLRDDLTSEGFVALVTAVRSANRKRDTTSYLSKSIRTSLRKLMGRVGVVSNRSSRLRTKPGQPKAVTTKDVSKYTLGQSVEPTSMIELRDLIDACCLSELDRTIVRMREERYTIRQIAKVVGLPTMTTQELWAAIRDRFEEKYLKM